MILRMKKLLKNSFLQKYFCKYPFGNHFVSPEPVYIDQLAGANLSKTKLSYTPLEDKKAAKRFGARSLEEFSFWSWRACGVACLQMVLKTANNKFDLKTMDLVNECFEMGGYCFGKRNQIDLGWYHQSLVDLGKKYGVKGRRVEPLTVYDIANFIYENKVVIASVDSPTGGHLILIFGVKTNKKRRITGFYYHNPSSFSGSGKNRFIKTSDLRVRLNGRGIVFSLS